MLKSELLKKKKFDHFAEFNYLQSTSLYNLSIQSTQTLQTTPILLSQLAVALMYSLICSRIPHIKQT